MQLAVNEIFGPTIQGEGPSLGRQATFLRLAMCNLKCVWCDTKFTWDWQHYRKIDEVHLMTPLDITRDLLSRRRTEMLVVTGGEPLLQQRLLKKVLLPQIYQRIEFETNGTVAPDEYWRWQRGVYFNVSPKLKNSQNRPVALHGVEALSKHERAIFKFVLESASELEEVEEMIDTYDLNRGRVYIMPQARSKEQLEQRLVLGHLAEAAVYAGLNLTTRLHIQIWNDKRGV